MQAVPTSPPTIPPTVEIRPAHLLDSSQIAEEIRSQGQDHKSVYDQLRWFLRVGHLVPVAREERGKKAYLLGPEQRLVADVLLRLREFGVQGSDDPGAGPFNSAQLALNHWGGNRPEGAKRSPAAHVVAEYEVGEGGWALEVHSFRHATKDWVQWEARIFHAIRREAPELRAMKSGDWFPRAVFAVDLTSSLDRWHPLARERREAMN